MDPDRLTQPKVAADGILERFYALERRVQCMAQDLAELRTREGSTSTAPRERRAVQICVYRAPNDMDVLYVLLDDGTIWGCHDGDDRHWVQVLPPPEPPPRRTRP